METIEIKINSNAKSATNEMALFRKEIQDLRGKLLQLDEGTKEYNDTLSELSNKQFQLREMNENVRYTVTDLGEQLGTVTRITSGVVAGFSAAQGMVALFGGESENLQKIMVRLQAAMAMVQGLQGLEGLGKDLGRAKIQFKGVLTPIKTFITGLSGVKKALLATGIGAFIVAIGTLIAYGPEITKFFQRFSNGAKQSAKEMKEFNKSIGEAAATDAAKLIVSLSSLATKYRELGNDIDAQNRFIKENAAELEKLGIKINNINDADNVFVNNTDEYINALIMRAKAQASVNVATQEYEEHLKKRAEIEAKLIQARQDLASTDASYDMRIDWFKDATYKDADGKEIKTNDFSSYRQSDEYIKAEKNVKSLENQLNEMDKKAMDKLTNAFKISTDLHNKANELLVDNASDTNASLKNLSAEQLAIRQAELKQIEQIQERIKDATTIDKTAEIAKLKSQLEQEKELFEKHNIPTTELESYYDKAIKASEDYLKKLKDNAAKAAKTKEDELKEIQKIEEKIKQSSRGEADNEIAELHKQFLKEKELYKRHGKDTTELVRYYDQAKADVKKEFEEDAKKRIEDEFNTWKTELETKINEINTSLDNSTDKLSTQDDGYSTGKVTAEEAYNNQLAIDDAILQAQREAYDQKKTFIEEQLNDESITAEREMVLQRALADNKIALDNAVLENSKRNAKTEELLEKRKVEVKKATLNATSQILSAMSTLVGENTAAGKAMAVSSALINTYMSATGAYNSAVNPPAYGPASPAMGALFAAAAVAQGLAQVKQILAVDENGTTSIGASSGVASTPNVTSGMMPTEIVGQQLSDMTDFEINQAESEMKVVVLESDITDTQNKIKTQVSESTF